MGLTAARALFAIAGTHSTPTQRCAAVTMRRPARMVKTSSRSCAVLLPIRESVKVHQQDQPSIAQQVRDAALPGPLHD